MLAELPREIVRLRKGYKREVAVFGCREWELPGVDLYFADSVATDVMAENFFREAANGKPVGEIFLGLIGDATINVELTPPSRPYRRRIESRFLGDGICFEFIEKLS
jgi:hypothetical protein